jgi:CRP-like cAMP-binding protein
LQVGWAILYRPPAVTQGDSPEGNDPTTARLIEKYGRAFRQGDVLFREGEPASQAFFLQEGRVRLLRRVHMVERSLSVLRPGDLFGEGALLDGAVRLQTAVALTNGVVLALDQSTLDTIVAGFPAITGRILAQLVRRLRDAEDQIEVLMLRDTQSKVVSALLKMTHGNPGPVELTVSPVDLSTRVGLDVETVKRAVQRLRDQQYLRIAGERVEIPDVEALRRLYALLGTKEELRGNR